MKCNVIVNMHITKMRLLIMNFYLKALFFLVLSTPVFGQKTPLDSVKIKQFQALNHMDGKYVLKVGTVYLDTRKSYQDSLYSLLNTIVISNGDKTLDVFYNKGFENKEGIIPIAEKFALQGFSDFKIAKLSLDSFIITLTIDEESDDRYTISLGVFDGVVPLQDLMKILSIKGIRTVWDEQAKKYTYLFGVYYNHAKAKEAVLQFENARLHADVLRYQKGFLSKVTPSMLYSSEELSEMLIKKNDPVIIDSTAVVFRVQVGTFSGNIPVEKFKERDVLLFPFGKKLTKCFSGSFDGYKQAYIHKTQLNQSGFKDAFIVAYRNGESLSIGELVSKEEYDKIIKEVSSGN